MIVYEFWLKEEFKNQAFESLCESFYSTGNKFIRKIDGIYASAVYGVSRNQNTNWVQLLVDDDTPPAILTALQARIAGLRDYTPMRNYICEHEHDAPMERMKE